MDFVPQLEMAFKREFGDRLNVMVDEVDCVYSISWIFFYLIILSYPHFSRFQIVVQNMCMKVSRRLLIWTDEHTYWIASRFLTLGFELELYSPNEYCMVYWYMYVVLMRLMEKMQMRIAINSETCKSYLTFEWHSCDSWPESLSKWHLFSYLECKLFDLLIL